MINFFSVIIFLLISNNAIASNSVFKSFEFFDGNIDKTIKIIINDSDWQHINEGKQTDDYFTGGHNYNIFFKKHVKNNPDASVFFDTQMNCYIVSSKKGDNLQTIIENLNAKKEVKYHSLFPEEILTKEFVFAAFEKAFKENNDPSIKESKVVHGKEKLFYTTINGLKICGYFLNNKKNKNTRNTYTITSFFPDVYWHYRLDIQEQPTISMNRFMEWSVIEKKWIGYQNNNLDNKNIYEPQCGRVIELTNKFYDLNNNNQLVSIGMKIRNKLIADLQNNNSQELDTFQYFFKNPSQPTDEEWKNMAYVVKFFTNFSCLKHKNKYDISHVKLNFKIYLSTNNRKIKDISFDHDNKKYICKKELLVINTTNSRRIVNGLHFAEELLRQILLVNNDVYSMIDNVEGFFTNQEDINKIRSTAKYFTDNFLDKILGTNLAKELKENQLSFEFRLIDVNKYLIEIIYPTELTADVILNSNHQSFVVCILEGNNAFPYKFCMKEFNN